MTKLKKDRKPGKRELERIRIESLPRPSAEDLAAEPQEQDRFEKDLESRKQSECTCCKKRIDVGDLIYWIPPLQGTNKTYARHATCAVTPAYQTHLDAALNAHRMQVLISLARVEQEIVQDPVLRDLIQFREPEHQILKL